VGLLGILPLLDYTRYLSFTDWNKSVPNQIRVVSLFCICEESVFLSDAILQPV
jgi:hypothetical protein